MDSEDWSRSTGMEAVVPDIGNLLIITEPAPVLPDLVGRSNPNSPRHGSRTLCFGFSASAAASPDPSDMVSLCIADGSPFLATAATAHHWKSVTSLQSWCDSSPTRCDALRQGCESSRSKCDQIPDKVRLISRQSATGLRVATPQSPDKVRTVSMDVTRRGRTDIARLSGGSSCCVASLPMPAWWHVERGRCGYARYEEWRPASEKPKQRILRTLSGDCDGEPCRTSHFVWRPLR